MVGSLRTFNVLEIAKRTGAVFLLASPSECYGDPLEHPQRDSFGDMSTDWPALGRRRGPSAFPSGHHGLPAAITGQHATSFHLHTYALACRLTRAGSSRFQCVRLFAERT